MLSQSVHYMICNTDEGVYQRPGGLNMPLRWPAKLDFRVTLQWQLSSRLHQNIHELGACDVS